MDREDNQSFADTFAQRAGVIAFFAIEGRGPPISFRQFECRVGLGKDIFGDVEEPVEVRLARSSSQLQTARRFSRRHPGNFR